MFVEAYELIEPIRMVQARRGETHEEIAALVDELVQSKTASSGRLTGQWMDRANRNTVYFRQVGDQVAGVYDYGTGAPVGVYRGTFKGRVLLYRWRWFDRSLEGQGRIVLSDDGQRLSGNWWYAQYPEKVEDLEFNRIADKMPSWLNEADFQRYLRS